MLPGERLVLKLGTVDGLAASAIAGCKVAALSEANRMSIALGISRVPGEAGAPLTWIMNCLMTR